MISFERPGFEIVLAAVGSANGIVNHVRSIDSQVLGLATRCSQQEDVYVPIVMLHIYMLQSPNPYQGFL